MNKSKIVFMVAAIVFALTTILALVGYLITASELDVYKNQSEIIVNEAVSEAKIAQKEEDTAHFFEEAKKPYAEYAGPSDFGSIKFSYPKTWSVYNSMFDENGYVVVFYPGVIPVVDDQAAMALRVSVLNEQYETVIAGYEEVVTAGQLKASAINVAKSENFAGYEGVRFDGAINEALPKGTIVALKLRDKTILLQTDADDWTTDFKDIILPTFRYVE